MMKKICLIISFTIIYLTLSGCKGDDITETWYEDDADQTEMILTDDGTFSYDGFGGTWSYEDGQVVLVADLMGISITLEKTTIGGCEVLTDGEYTYYKDLSELLDVQEEREAQRLAEEASLEAERQEQIDMLLKEYSAEFVGEWYEKATWYEKENGEEFGNDILTIQEDGTYIYKDFSDFSSEILSEIHGNYSLEGDDTDSVKINFDNGLNEDGGKSTGTMRLKEDSGNMELILTFGQYPPVDMNFIKN